MTAPVTVTDEGAVRIIRLNRPEKKNALTLAMYAEMARALREADQSGTIRCSVIAGVPGAFCAGNDITDFLNASSGGLDARTQVERRGFGSAFELRANAGAGPVATVGQVALAHLRLRKGGRRPRATESDPRPSAGVVSSSIQTRATQARLSLRTTDHIGESV